MTLYALPIFLLHAGWMAYIALELRENTGKPVEASAAGTDTDSDSGDSAESSSPASDDEGDRKNRHETGLAFLPRSLQTIKYLHIINLEHPWRRRRRPGPEPSSFDHLP
eukprot:CAMPEP_0180681162 /NCGR_PEP_ID=MMETSP1037_2-20121125/69849_1 /TAXON_ID=632150 /ORGANISM="Azadinium spinosum, Strain 3D9" /LENGTH=108 /DNA_ID=CAMNT_0022711015 /DNA_START=219 /DNA_END=542 /DNA_ORIENTATION=-